MYSNIRIRDAFSFHVSYSHHSNFSPISQCLVDATSSLNVDLPKVSSQDVPREAQQTTVQIRKNGDLFLNETKVDIISLPGLLQHINSESIDHAVVVQADEAVTHGKVVNIMDICKNSGFNKLSIAANIK